MSMCAIILGANSLFAGAEFRLISRVLTVSLIVKVTLWCDFNALEAKAP